ncbi:MAG TPA: hypothetical protein VID29_08685 [Solirubrobacteraceae bacterium]|jgi:hypothetical protein
MPEPKVKRPAARRAPARRAAAPKTAATRTRSAEDKKRTRAHAADRTAVLSDDVLKSLDAGQRAAIDAVRKFVDTVEEKLPARGERPAKRQDIVDAALEMADRLVHTQYDFLRTVVHSAGKALSGSDGASKK